MTVASIAAPSELTVTGGRPLRGRLRLPGCKGISHRALLFAAIADGRSTIRGLADGADVAATAECLDALGVRVKQAGDALTVRGGGLAGLRESETVLDCANSGTTMRMLAGLLAGRDFLSVLVGDESLSTRPMRRVLDPLAAMGATVDGRDGGRLAPLTVRGGALRGIRHELATASGQVKTALVLAGLQADGTTEIVEPSPSRDHTERMLDRARRPADPRRRPDHPGHAPVSRVRSSSTSPAIRRRRRSSSSPRASSPARTSRSSG